MGKAYSALGQAAAFLHTMFNLLRDLDEGEEVSSDTLRQTTDLSLWATKEKAKSAGHSMAAPMAKERHLWINLTVNKEKDKSFILDVPLSPAGLFRDAVNSVAESENLKNSSLYALRSLVLLGESSPSFL